MLCEEVTMLCPICGKEIKTTIRKNSEDQKWKGSDYEFRIGKKDFIWCDPNTGGCASAFVREDGEFHIIRVGGGVFAPLKKNRIPKW